MPAAAEACAKLKRELHKGVFKGVTAAVEYASHGRFREARDNCTDAKLVGSLVSNGVTLPTLVDWLVAIRWPDCQRAADLLETIWFQKHSDLHECGLDRIWIARQNRPVEARFFDAPSHKELADELERLCAPPMLLDHFGELVDDIQPFSAEMVEFVDEEGLAEAERQVRALLRESDPERKLDSRARRRALYMREFCKTVREQYATPTTCRLVDGAKIKVLAMVSKYETRYNTDGRLYSLNRKIQKDEGKTDAKPRTIDVAGMPRALRPFLLQRFARDLDQSNSQAVILLQMAERLAPEVDVTELRAYNNDRKSLFDHVCETYDFMHLDEEARKELVKPLVLRLMFSGSLKGWQLSNGIDPRSAPACPRISRLERELRALRAAIFAHAEWNRWVHRDRIRQTEVQGRRPEHARKNMEDIERSIFARIAQSQENVILTSMRRYLATNGFCALSLVFDGIVVINHEKAVDLDAMSALIKKETGYDMKVLEKPMYTGTSEWPALSLSE